QASLGFLQDADDLLFGESLFHCRSSLERTLHRHRTKRGEQVTAPSPDGRKKAVLPNKTERRGEKEGETQGNKEARAAWAATHTTR
ncbi:hypothetical protein, partial [Burkholderia cenocepacia]|uniref:hypothetical protein n=1 Tax=Burkholderia cenocepacia TaxID=95486 RepID=UPI0026555B79